MSPETGDGDDGGSYDDADGCQDDDVDVIDYGGDGGVHENYDCGRADGDCDGTDEVEDGIVDDEGKGDDGVFLMLHTYVRMSMTVWCRWWRRCG